jgi:hypothetical protein
MKISKTPRLPIARKMPTQSPPKELKRELVDRLSVLLRMVKDAANEFTSVISMNAIEESLSSDLQRHAKQLAVLADDLEGLRKRAMPPTRRAKKPPPR